MLITSEGSFKKELKKLPDPDLLSKTTGPIQKVCVNVCVRARDISLHTNTILFASFLSCVSSPLSLSFPVSHPPALVMVSWQVNLILLRHGESEWNGVFNKVWLCECVSRRELIYV